MKLVIGKKFTLNICSMKRKKNKKVDAFQWMALSNSKKKFEETGTMASGMRKVEINTEPAIVDKGRSKLSREGFYASTKWIKIRNSFRKKNPLCVRCKSMGINRPMSVVDHILPADDYPDLIWDFGNLQSLCDPCHWWKTAVDSAHRRGHKVKHLNQDLMDELESPPIVDICGHKYTT